MKIKAFIRFDTYHDFVEFLNLKEFALDMEAAYPELRTVQIVFEGCDDV